jgi:hypothetical protein
VAPAPAPDDDEDTRPWHEQAQELIKKLQALTPVDKSDIIEITGELLQFVDYEAALAVQGAAAANA